MMTGLKAKPVRKYSTTDIPEKSGNENFSFPLFMLTPCLEEQGMKQGETRNYN